MTANAYGELERRFRRISRIEHMLSMGKWDEAVCMPVGGGGARATALAELATIKNEILHHPELDQLIEAAQQQTELDAWQRANLREIQRIREQAVAVPIELEEAFTLATLETEQAWRQMRKDNDWVSFQPLLGNVVGLARERSVCLAEHYGCEPYEALMGVYQTDFTRHDIDTCFSLLRSELPSLLQQISAQQRKQQPTPITGTFDISMQQALSRKLMQQMGFDFQHGRLDVTHHPFCGGVPEDIRINTRYYEHDFTESIMATIHETGHGRYEQGLPAAWLEQPVGQSRGMAVHESQSLMFEMQIARSKPFLRFLQPLLQQFFAGGCDCAAALSLDNILKVYRHVQPGLIRTSADEVTYPLHVVLRYEIERDLIEGHASVDDIPERWDVAMQSMLGLSTYGNFKDGCMQDVHWPAGAFGYFPFYTLGALLAAQLKAALIRDCGPIDSQLEQGDISQVSNWLRENVWQRGCLLTSRELIKSASGEALSAEYFLRHIKERYLDES